MRCWLMHLSRDYTLTDRMDAPHGVEPLYLSDRFLAEHFVAMLHEDAFSREGLYDIAYRHVFGSGAEYTDRDVIAQIAQEISSGRILVFEGRFPEPAVHCLVTRRPVTPPAPVAAPGEQAHFFEVEVLDDRTGSPVPDVKIEITLADGSKRLCTTGRDGRIRLEHAQPGSHMVCSPLGGATLSRTLEIVSAGEAPSGGKPGPKKKVPGKTTAPASGHHRPLSIIAHVTAHKVKSGDTIPGLAGANHMTQSELSHFNWGVSSVAEIEQRLRDEVGCRKRSERGRHVLDDADDPGVIFLPRRWIQRSLGVDQCHTFRVRPVARALPDLRFLYQIDTHDPYVKNDTLTLETEDGSWSHEVPVSALTEVHPGWVELVFPEPPPGQNFHLVQDPKDGQEPFYAFHGLTHGELLDAREEQLAQDATDSEDGGDDRAGDGQAA